MPEVKLNAKHFEDLVERRGVPVYWERALKCTCWTENSGQPNYYCKACHGDGFIYAPPVFTDNILIMSLALNKEFTQLGEYKMGDCIATVPKRTRVKENGVWAYPDNPVYEIGDWDRVTLVNTDFRAHELLVHQESQYGRQADTLRNPIVTTIVSVLKANSETGAVTFYTKDVDYHLGTDGKIEWVAGANSPGIGEQYSVTYFHKPVYVVYTQLPQNRDQDDQHFPKKLILRYRDVI